MEFNNLMNAKIPKKLLTDVHTIFTAAKLREHNKIWC